MTQLQKITKFIANDGTEFNTAVEAREYNKHSAEVERIADVTTKLLSDDIIRVLANEFSAGKDAVAEIIATHADALKKALIAATVQRRGPRKAKEEVVAA